MAGDALWLCDGFPIKSYISLLYVFIGDVTDCCAACERETDIAILMDSSANIGVSKFTTLRSVAADVIELLSIETGDVRVAVVTYAQHADVNVYLGR